MRVAVAGGTGTVGRFVVDIARQAGHEVAVLSRSTGVDLVTGRGLEAALAGVEVVIDTLNSPTLSRAQAASFFTQTTRHLHTAGAAGGVERLVTLSIVGLERVPGYGYYEAKLAQEAAVRSGPLPVTILRATQFHEFPGQILSRTRVGPFAAVPMMRTQPVAARTVAEKLVDLAGHPAVDELLEIAGPEPAELVALARALLAGRGRRTMVVPLRLPGAAGKAMRDGGALPGPDVPTAGPTFARWLDDNLGTRR